MEEEKEVVNCRTQVQWDFVCKKLGYTWAGNNISNIKKGETCLNLHSQNYDCIRYYSREGYKIYTFDEWLNKRNLNLINQKGMENIMLDVLNKTYDNPVLRKKTVPLFMSNPGTGKTSIIKKFAEDKGVKIVKITLSQRMPNEVVGMVMPDITTNRLVVYDSHELTSLNDGDVLFFDEVFNGTLKQTLDAVLNLLEDRMLPSGKKLADVLIVAASNPQGLINLTPQIKERFVRYDLKFQKEEYQKILKDKYGMPKSISNHLCLLIGKEKFEHDAWNFTTPRSIEKAINQIGCELASPYEDVLLPFLNEQLDSPIDISTIGVKKGDKVEYLKLLKLIVQKESYEKYSLAE